MKPEQQRIAIAEACGWKNIKREWVGCGSGDAKDYLGDNPTGGRWYIPEYLNSLDAMHEAEKVLTSAQQYDFECQLSNTVLGLTIGSDYWPMIHATAAQRSEAFLRCTGKWEDAK